MESRPLTDLLSTISERERVEQEWREEIGGKLRAARQAVGVSQGRLSAALDKPQSYISAVENGRKTPTSETVGEFYAYFSSASTEGGADAQDEGAQAWDAKADLAQARRKQAQDD